MSDILERKSLITGMDPLLVIPCTGHELKSRGREV